MIWTANLKNPALIALRDVSLVESLLYKRVNLGDKKTSYWRHFVYVKSQRRPKFGHNFEINDDFSALCYLPTNYERVRDDII